MVVGTERRADLCLTNHDVNKHANVDEESQYLVSKLGSNDDENERGHDTCVENHTQLHIHQLVVSYHRLGIAPVRLNHTTTIPL